MIATFLIFNIFNNFKEINQTFSSPIFKVINKNCNKTNEEERYHHQQK